MSFSLFWFLVGSALTGTVVLIWQRTETKKKILSEREQHRLSRESFIKEIQHDPKAIFPIGSTASGIFNLTLIVMGQNIKAFWDLYDSMDPDTKEAKLLKGLILAYESIALTELKMTYDNFKSYFEALRNTGKKYQQ